MCQRVHVCKRQRQPQQRVQPQQLQHISRLAAAAAVGIPPTPPEPCHSAVVPSSKQQQAVPRSSKRTCRLARLMRLAAALEGLSFSLSFRFSSSSLHCRSGQRGVLSLAARPGR